jgi:hypothetical protein
MTMTRPGIRNLTAKLEIEFFAGATLRTVCAEVDFDVSAYYPACWDHPEEGGGIETTASRFLSLTDHRADGTESKRSLTKRERCVVLEAIPILFPEAVDAAIEERVESYCERNQGEL